MNIAGCKMWRNRILRLAAWLVLPALVCLLNMTGSGVPASASANTTITTTPAVSAWDVNGDGVCDVSDSMLVGMHLDETGAPGWIKEDVNRDGVIDDNDMQAVRSHYSAASASLLPVITAFTPTSGAAGTQVTIKGSRLGNAGAVSFGGTAAQSIVSNTADTIVAVVGAGATGPVRVATAAGAATLAGFTFLTGNPTPSLSVSLADLTVAPGGALSVKIIIDAGSTAVRGASFSFTFDAKKLQCAGVDEGTFFSAWAGSHNCETLVYPAAEINNASGLIPAIGFAIMGATAGGPSGAGELCTIRFTAFPAASGQARLNITGAQLVEAADQSVGVQNISNLYNAQVTVGASTFTPPATGAPTAAPTTTVITHTTVPATPDTSANATAAMVFDLDGLADNRGAAAADYSTRQSSGDWQAALQIKQGTSLQRDGETVTEIAIYPVNPLAVPDTGKPILGVFECRPDGSTFSPPVTLSFQYDPALVPAGTKEDNLKLLSYDAAGGRWLEVASQVDAATHTITAGISHFSYLAVVAGKVYTASWNIFAVIVAGESLIIIGVIVLINVIRRRRAAPAAAAESIDVAAAVTPGPSEGEAAAAPDVPAGRSVFSRGGDIELVQSILIDQSNRRENALDIVFDETRGDARPGLPLEINLKHVAGNNNIIRVRILRRVNRKPTEE